MVAARYARPVASAPTFTELVESRGYTLEQLTYRIGRDALNGYMTRQRTPRADKLEQMARLLRVTPRAILDALARPNCPDAIPAAEAAPPVAPQVRPRDLADTYADRLLAEMHDERRDLFFPEIITIGLTRHFDRAVADNTEPGCAAVGELAHWQSELRYHQLRQAIMLAYTAGYRAAK